MKINYRHNNIYSVDKINLLEDATLAYLNSEYKSREIHQEYNSNYNYKKKNAIIPYQNFKDIDITLYDSTMQEINDKRQESLFKKGLSDYYYLQEADIIFNPMIFTYNLLIKKKMKYVTDKIYNIKAVCATNDLAERLIQYFSDAYERGICASNLMFNGGSRIVENLINLSFKESDFVFLRATDGENMSENVKIPIEDIINANAVPFIICDYIEKEEDYADKEELEFKLDQDVAMDTKSYSTKYYFSNIEEQEGEKIHNVFKYYKESPIIIKELYNKGFVIYCNSDFFSRLKENYDIFYEILLYVYMNNYIRTGDIKEWITDQIPDYIVQNEKLTQKTRFTSYLELHKMVGLNKEDFKLIDVNILPQNGEESPMVFYKGMTDEYIIFEKNKNSKYMDPLKKDEQKSIYTEREQVMYFSDFLYQIEDAIEDYITSKIENDILIVQINKFKSTSLNTKRIQPTTILKYGLENNASTIYLTYDKSTYSFALKEKNEYKDIILVTYNIENTENNNKLFDMRVRGGGVRDENKAINKSLFDISNVVGKPYRQAGTMIVTLNLDSKYKKQEQDIKTKIYNELSSNAIGEDYILIQIKYKGE